MLRKASGALQPTTCHSQALSQRASRSCRTRSGLVTPPRTIAPLGPPGLEAGEQFVGRDNRVDLAAQSSGAICALSVFTSGLAGTAEPTIVLWPACLAPFRSAADCVASVAESGGQVATQAVEAAAEAAG